MKDETKTKEELIKELQQFRRQVTRLEKAEHEWNKEEELDLRARMLDQSRDGIMLHDTEGNFLYANEVVLKERGYTREEFLKMNVGDLVTAKQYSKVKRWWKDTGDEKHRTEEVEIRRKDGTWFPVEVNTTKDNYGGKTYILCTTRDITERKKAEEVTKQNQRELEMLLDSLPEIVFYKDTHDRLLRCNKGFTIALGMSREEVLGKTTDDLFPEQAENMKRDDREVMESGQPRIGIIEPYDTPEGTRWAQSSKIPIRDKDDKVTGLIGIATDITERKKAEEALRANEQELEILMENLPGMVFYKDSNLRYRRVNKAFTQLHNIQREEIIGRTIGEASLMNAEFAESDDRELMKSGQVSSRISEHPDETGEPRWQQITKVPIKDDKGKICGILGVGVDISNILKAQEDLKLRAEMLDQSRNGIIVSDTNGDFIYGNKVVLEERGYTREEFLKLNVRDLVVMPDDGSFNEWWHQVVEKGYFRGEYEVRCKDGSLIPVEAILTKAKSGVREYVISVVQNIAERKQAEEELRLRAEMLDQASDGIMLRDFNGNLLYANETAIKDRGYTREEFFKLTSRDLVVAEPDSGRVEEWWQEVREKGYRHTEYGVRHKDGSLVPMDTMATKIKSGDKEYILTVTRDITERKKAEEELKLRMEMLDQSGDAIMIRDDIDGNCVYVNETALRERGYSRDEFMKTKGNDLVQVIHVTDKETRDKWRQEIMEQGRSQCELNIIRKDGTLFPVEVMGTLINIGTERYILFVARNITERKKAEAERAELERKAQVSSRLASVGEMASGIAHEINNPLTGVVGFAQLLADRKDLPEDVREQLKVIHEGGERVSNIIQRLLTFARQSKPKRTYLDINEVIEETIRLRQYELKTNNIELIKQFDPDLPWTMADAGQLQQVFINLVVNAEQEMSRAHGKGRLEVRTELAGGMIHISFKDDGTGITKENMGKLFDPFFTTREVGQGTGLGLSLSHGIIVEHGGKLYAESEPGKGATFVVELPVLVEEEGVKGAKAEAEEMIKDKILVVDDEQIVKQYLDKVLTKMGHSVELVSDGEEALKRVKATRYGLILTDIKMPGMSGPEFYRRVREMDESLAARMVFITGDVMGEGTSDFILKTGADYVAKPFDVGKLSWVVNKVLGGFKNQRLKIKD